MTNTSETSGTLHQRPHHAAIRSILLLLGILLSTLWAIPAHADAPPSNAAYPADAPPSDAADHADAPPSDVHSTDTAPSANVYRSDVPSLSENENHEATGWYYEDRTRQWYYYTPLSPGETRIASLADTSLSQTASSVADIAISAVSPPLRADARLHLKTGWHHDIDGFTYYLDPADGHMLDGSQTIDGRSYHFLPERNRGNYHQDARGRWYYRANGLATYGSLQSGTPPEPDHRYPIIDSSALVTDRLTKPKKESSNGSGTSSDSSTPPDDSSTSPDETTPPDPTPPETPDPSETPDPPTPPETPDPPTPPDDQRHPHTEDPSVHCIATDDWATIRANPTAYHDCITNHCTALLYLSGPEITEPIPSTDPARHHYPLYVSLVDDHDQLTFAQAYAIPELSDVPIYVGTNQHYTETGATYTQTNAGGLPDTWLYRMLAGTDHGTSFSFYLEEDDGTHTRHEFTYPGYELRIPDEDAQPGTEKLPLQPIPKYLSRGYLSESGDAETLFYQKYLARSAWKEAKLSQLMKVTSRLWFPSEQELRDYTLEDASGTTGNTPRSIYLKSEHMLPELADSWRSSESYWLRSTPSAYLTDEEYEDLGLDETEPRDEYFLIADPSGSAALAHYDDTAAVRLMFTVK